ncbi:helix-turn-helix transcriptional regulator [Sphingobacterium multivorum]|uniref:helix-turn-helix transcriptional regulator n=1 Tax=Sphingobacterium TaxID=28453 RepID=UPI000B492C23|nr:MULTISPECIES: helix-turn-helix transcriptional regulator [Sphingobacterium]
MTKKSQYELEIVKNSIQIRNSYNKSQSYFAMLLDVTDGYIGNIENPNRPEMYTHDQINAIAIDLGISPRLFYPDIAIDQPLPKRDAQAKLERTNLIKLGVDNLINSNFFDSKKSIKEIIVELNQQDSYLKLDLTNKDLTDVLRPIAKLNTLKSVKVGTRNYYYSF